MDDEPGERQTEMSVCDEDIDPKGSNDETTDEEEPLIDFEDPLFELSQSYEMEPEYENMTPEQEAAEVKSMMPQEQAKYHELKQFHWHQVELNKEMTGISKMIKERTNARTPGIPTDLVKRHVQEEPPECQEVERFMPKMRYQGTTDPVQPEGIIYTWKMIKDVW